MTAEGRTLSPADEIMAESHGAVWARGEQSYAHLGVAQSCSPEALHFHMLTAHGLVPTNPGDGSWCRDVERHASVHDVTLQAKR